MEDTFFTQEKCDGCCASLSGQARKMSWFTDDCLCEHCSKIEGTLRNALDSKGIDTSELEGCGFTPSLEASKEDIQRSIQAQADLERCVSKSQKLNK